MFCSHGRTRTYNQSVNSRTLHHWATCEWLLRMMESNHQLWVMSPTRYPFSNPPAPIITTPDRWWHSTRGVKTGLLSGTDNPANRLLVLISLRWYGESNPDQWRDKPTYLPLYYITVVPKRGIEPRQPVLQTGALPTELSRHICDGEWNRTIHTQCRYGIEP